MRDAKAAPPGNVEASVPVWADAARKVLALVRSRPISAVTTASLSRCPSCGSSNLQRSHVRFYEKPRKALGASRPYRCGSCRRRVWGQLLASPGGRLAGKSGLSSDAKPLDLTELDRALERH